MMELAVDWRTLLSIKIPASLLSPDKMSFGHFTQIFGILNDESQCSKQTETILLIEKNFFGGQSKIWHIQKTSGFSSLTCPNLPTLTFPFFLILAHDNSRRCWFFFQNQLAQVVICRVNGIKFDYMHEAKLANKASNCVNL